ncbi:hypothetical protein Vadar_027752 [Vaccinium darrowii]|uniref:Uncharacterized protein n=1 Tax=Vaccinium darrowii TaxID=229202 RepID=A0ACB7XKK2_9ERIC|nr:hypothetical protein Vadar_027752 [Vaccinium darrowii]
MDLKKTSRVLLTILWLSLFLLFFHKLHTFNHSNINGTVTSSASSLSDHRHPIPRKFLATKFDFTPFIKHRHRHRKNTPYNHGQPGPSGSEIDPRYGVEKRLVPTGPNPLHH